MSFQISLAEDYTTVDATATIAVKGTVSGSEAFLEPRAIRE
jgi:hypothetical protein